MGVRISPENLARHQQRANIALLHRDRVNHILLFIQTAYAAQGRTNNGIMRVLIDCSWMLTELVRVEGAHIVDFLTAIHHAVTNANRLFVMLDFGLDSFGIMDYALSGDTLRHEIDTLIRRDAGFAAWYHPNVSIVWPNQTVFCHQTSQSSLLPVENRRKSMPDRCSCSTMLIDLRFGHTCRGEKYMHLNIDGRITPLFFAGMGILSHNENLFFVV